MARFIRVLIKSLIHTLLVFCAAFYTLKLFIPSIYTTVPTWMFGVILLEIFFAFFVVRYAQKGLYNTLKTAIDASDETALPSHITEVIHQIEYNGRSFIYDYFKNNIRDKTNTTGKQACEFINEEEILKSFTHIELLRIAPSLITSAGLCCTFIAILLGLAGVQVSGDGNIQGIQNLVNNLAGKFSTSIVALILAIFINYKSSVLFAEIHAMFLKIKLKIDEAFPIQTMAESLQNPFQSLSSEISAQFLQGVQKLSNFMQNEDTDNFLEKGNTLAMTLSKAATELQNHIIKIQNIEEQINAASASLANFNHNMTDIAGVSENLRKIQEALSINNQTLEENYNEMVKQLPIMQDKFTETCEKMRGHLNDNIDQALVDSLKDVLEAHSQRIEQALNRANKPSPSNHPAAQPDHTEADTPHTTQEPQINPPHESTPQVQTTAHTEQPPIDEFDPEIPISDIADNAEEGDNSHIDTNTPTEIRNPFKRYWSSLTASFKHKE